MSTHATGSNNPIDVDAQSEKVALALALADERDDDLIRLLVEIVEEQHTQIEEQSSLVEALRRKLKQYREDNEKDKADIRRFATEKAEEATSQDATGGGDTDETTPQRRETPLERLLADPQNSGIRVTESVNRALSVAGHFKQWANNRQAGRVIIENIKTLLSTAVGEQLSWKQVHRACHKLEELTNGAIEFRNTDRHGRILVMEDPSWLSNVVSVPRGS